MKVLVGVDIQPIDEVETSLLHFGDRYRGFLFTDHELESCGETPGCAPKLAARFAAKEAVLKILDTEEMVPSWRSIEVTTSTRGGLKIVLHDTAALLAQQQGIDAFSVSVSHCADYAIAAVTATTSFAASEIVQ
jgi:holo-[acyl-carrier protein] synthase